MKQRKDRASPARRLKLLLNSFHPLGVIISVLGPAFLAMALSLSPCVWAMGGRDKEIETLPLPPSSRAAWYSLLEEGREAGLQRSRLEQTVVNLARAGISPEDAREILSPAYEAARAGLPADPVLSKLDEGALKGAFPEVLAFAGRKRKEWLQKARDIMVESAYRPSSPSGEGLLISSALALESGMPQSILKTALEKGKDKPVNQIKSVIEAVEALHLEGFEPRVVEALTEDFIQHDLQRPELLRVVRFASAQRRQGMAPMAIREILWGRGIGLSRQGTANDKKHGLNQRESGFQGNMPGAGQGHEAGRGESEGRGEESSTGAGSGHGEGHGGEGGHGNGGR